MNVRIKSALDEIDKLILAGKRGGADGIEVLAFGVFERNATMVRKFLDLPGIRAFMEDAADDVEPRLRSLALTLYAARREWMDARGRPKSTLNKKQCDLLKAIEELLKAYEQIAPLLLERCK